MSHTTSPAASKENVSIVMNKSKLNDQQPHSGGGTSKFMEQVIGPMYTSWLEEK